ncbi:hypothetical protein B7755_016030 [Streptomyces sp. NBS 14/10]|uniref:hypothetical protein n=1 Tax=Streptomyces sp. NBS 14/10 TaxID=1945643 RepID=UPI001C528406|nr:hypothetical protein [Streptomyces sp. NBS 14/10]KAK1186543.1 hypothetical protein B7755_016030 [Streptomyces sp. NBS 14/10]
MDQRPGRPRGDLRVPVRHAVGQDPRAARSGLTMGGKPVTPLVPWTFLQVVFLAARVAAAV